MTGSIMTSLPFLTASNMALGSSEEMRRCYYSHYLHIRQKAPEEGRRVQRPKRCDYNNQDEDNSPKYELKIKIDQACTAGDEFHKLYYETYDKKRHMLSKLYLNNAKLVWNGNFVEGITDILEFIENLPSTETSVDTFDCHPLSDTFSQGQTTIAVIIFGSVKYHKQKARAFHQHFILTSQDNFCRIVSDDYRFLD